VTYDKDIEAPELVLDSLGHSLDRLIVGDVELNDLHGGDRAQGLDLLHGLLASLDFARAHEDMVTLLLGKVEHNLVADALVATRDKDDVRGWGGHVRCGCNGWRAKWRCSSEEGNCSEAR
jgi:hypothetical protein